MLRPYFPEFLKGESVEFALECISAVALGAAVLRYLF